MLDSVLKHKNTKDMDWIYVQRALDRVLSRVLFWWILFVVFITPLFVFLCEIKNITIFFVLFFVFSVVICWLLWLARELFAFDRIIWQKSWLNLSLFVLFIEIIVSALKISNYNFTIFYPSLLSSLIWISLIGFSILIMQVKFIKFTHVARFAVAGFIVMFIAIVVFFSLNKQVANFGIIGMFGNSSVSNSTSLLRFVKYGAKDYAGFGVGMGYGKIGFWQQAENVNLEAMLSDLPNIGGFYANLLWDSGVLFTILFVIFIFGFGIGLLLRAQIKLPKVAIKSKHLIRNMQFLTIIFLFWLVFLWFKVLTFLTLFATFLFIITLALFSKEIFGLKHGLVNTRTFFSLGLSKKNGELYLLIMRILFFVLIIFLIFGARAVIKLGLRQDDVLSNLPAQSWSMARSLSKTDPVKAKELYDYAVNKMPRNLVLLTEVARFYRYSEKNKDFQNLFKNSKKQENSLINKALDIDPDYLPAIIEKTEQFKKDGDLNNAFLILEPYVSKDSNISYSVARMALDLNNFDKAVEYYELAIELNPKNLQARFELAQAYIALGKADQASDELDKLESFVADDDIQTREVIAELRKVIE